MNIRIVSRVKTAGGPGRRCDNGIRWESGACNRCCMCRSPISAARAGHWGDPGRLDIGRGPLPKCTSQNTDDALASSFRLYGAGRMRGLSCEQTGMVLFGAVLFFFGQHRTSSGTHLACISFLHIARKSSAIHQVFPAVFRRSEENSDCAICAPELCGIALGRDHVRGCAEEWVPSARPL